MARAQAKTNNNNKSSSKKPEAPPPAATPITNVAPMAQAAPAKKETPAVQTAAAPTRSRPTAEQISRRAYELFLARGGEHGHHDEDWIQAERELQLGR
ncbi:DUF2934 domain-containing protein [Cystobacter ferrugineus]|uniref:DUF2934 domain-containing protein n=1 Tax=Cystobacter ferrugineus TaxID=83449 RepID=A0A1L9BF02_9BACT|nr:DUF2934 domain-containing protein [Cystobacter ferrugineus]OJH40788.1 hypothetical protein BON30_07555 [Cystobacter ferrugineus]